MSKAAVADRARSVRSPAPSSTASMPPAASTPRAKPTPRAAPDPRDAFPHTRRPLPWLLAGFLAMLFFIPNDATELKIHIGVDSHPDRFAVIGLVLAWLWFGGDQRAFV